MYYCKNGCQFKCLEYDDMLQHYMEMCPKQLLYCPTCKTNVRKMSFKKHPCLKRQEMRTIALSLNSLNINEFNKNEYNNESNKGESNKGESNENQYKFYHNYVNNNANTHKQIKPRLKRKRLSTIKNISENQHNNGENDEDDNDEENYEKKLKSESIEIQTLSIKDEPISEKIQEKKCVINEKEYNNHNDNNNNSHNIGNHFINQQINNKRNRDTNIQDANLSFYTNCSAEKKIKYLHTIPLIVS